EYRLASLEHAAFLEDATGHDDGVHVTRVTARDDRGGGVGSGQQVRMVQPDHDQVGFLPPRQAARTMVDPTGPRTFYGGEGEQVGRVEGGQARDTIHR